jgi:hypothetical protein
MSYEIATLEQEQIPLSRGSDFIEQRTVWCADARTADSASALVDVSPVPLNEMVPLSFLNSLLDFQAGRVVDIDIALSEPPPGA